MNKDEQKNREHFKVRSKIFHITLKYNFFDFESNHITVFTGKNILKYALMNWETVKTQKSSNN